MAKIYLEMSEVRVQDRLTRETASVPQNEASQVDETWRNHIK